MNKDYEIGRLIRQRRTDLGYTLKEVADYCGVSESTVGRWETGKIATVKRSQLYQLSQILHISINALMGISDVEIPASTILKREKNRKASRKMFRSAIG